MVDSLDRSVVRNARGFQAWGPEPALFGLQQARRSRSNAHGFALKKCCASPLANSPQFLRTSVVTIPVVAEKPNSESTVAPFQGRRDSRDAGWRRATSIHDA